ncbi:hypothetical protein MHU86_12345 [Fragilaria crotonensis]|nr:hypothetical protein MHU86_12345 [Fragilaria crotonensis]
MYSTHEAELDVPALPLAARRVHIVPALAHVSLLSMGQLCDAGCRVTFDAVAVTVHLHEHLLLTGTRSLPTGLWHLSLVSPVADASDMPVTANSATAPFLCSSSCSSTTVHSATPSELVAFAHAALFSPALSTLHGALDRGYLSAFLGLTSRKLTAHPPHSVAMIKGHLDQTRINQRSTKAHKPAPPPRQPTSAPDNAADLLCQFPPSDHGNHRTHHCFASIIEPAAGQIHTDQTGKFVVASSTGNNYILVLYDYDSNSILVEPMRSRTGPCILGAFKTLHTRLVTAGLQPQLHRLDNECSTALKQFLTTESVDFQLVPPGMHRRNAAEGAIRTFKNHFIAGLCSVDKNFPLYLWDKLLPQAELTLNLLRGSRINPRLSAHAQLHGAFDFNRTPLAPPGIRVLVHVKPAERTTWSPHGADGWYTGPALESYRSYTVWLWDTRATRICDTLSWFPTKNPMPLASSNDLILAGLQNILQALRHPSPGSPLAPLPDSHHQALTQLTSILTSLAAPPITGVVCTGSDTPAGPPPCAPPAPPDSPLRVPAPTLPPPPPDQPLRVAAPTVQPPPPLAVPHQPVGPRRVQFALSRPTLLLIPSATAQGSSAPGAAALRANANTNVSLAPRPRRSTQINSLLLCPLPVAHPQPTVMELVQMPGSSLLSTTLQPPHARSSSTPRSVLLAGRCLLALPSSRLPNARTTATRSILTQASSLNTASLASAAKARYGKLPTRKKLVASR